MKLLCLILLTGLIAAAGENAVLANGFRLHADSHTADGAVVTLKTQQGDIAIPSGLIVRFEADDYVPPPPAVSQHEAQSADESPTLTPQELVTRAANHAGLPPAFVHSVARAESGYRTDAVSPKGAIGLMQLMPATAATLNADPKDPEQNAEAGAQYLRQLLERYAGDEHQVSKAVAAYNAGPAAVDKYNGVPPYRETVEYVNRVLQQYEKEQKKNPQDDN